MKKLSSSLPHLILSLGLITIVVGAVLAWVYEITEDPIAQVEKQKKVKAIAAVTPPFDNDPMAETVEVEMDGHTIPVHIATQGGKLVGGAVDSYSMNGFSGEIDVIYGFNRDGEITGYQVIKHAETPGLGAKMEQWFRDPQGDRSVIGRNPGTKELTVKKDGGQIDAITAATISSRAFLDALNRASRAYQQAKTQYNE
ncbi:MAG: RnfABCDGE type electron transport complex subunit G [Bacteroidales bacterium]|nr:RnfABCDGE type electron transport complex subunit G [Bacteroidales bacterium]